MSDTLGPDRREVEDPDPQSEAPSRVYCSIPSDYYSWTDEQQRDWIDKMIYPAVKALRGSSPATTRMGHTEESSQPTGEPA